MYTRSNNLAAVFSAVLQIIQQRASLSQRLEQTVRVVMATGFSSGPKRDRIYFFPAFFILNAAGELKIMPYATVW